MFSKLLFIGLGGAAGSMLRYLCQRSMLASFPVGTLVVNIAGCFLIGLLWGWWGKGQDTAKLVFVTGFCGGFTTFSAFSQETVELLQQQLWWKAGLYIAASIAGGLLATFIGFKITS